jgi:hypothetical protein
MIAIVIVVAVAVAIPVGSSRDPGFGADSPPAGAMNDILALFANIHYGVTRSPRRDSPSRGAWCIVAGDGAVPDGTCRTRSANRRQVGSSGFRGTSPPDPTQT